MRRHHPSERSHGYSRDIYHGRTGPGGHYRDTTQYGPDAGNYYPAPDRAQSYEYSGPGNYYEGPFEYDGPEGRTSDLQGAGLTRNVREPFDVWAGSDFRGYGGDVRHRGQRLSGAYGRGTAYHSVESDTWEIPGPHSGKGPRGYRRSDDRIHEDVCDRLASHGRLDASRLDVQVENGEVTLEGTVEDRRQKRLAEALAEGVRGVEDVHNRLRLARHAERDEGDRTNGREQVS